MTKKNDNLFSMGTPSSVIQQLATEVDVPVVIMDIAKNYSDNTDILPIQEKFTSQNNYLNDILKERFTHGNVLKDQHNVKKEVVTMNCRETFLILIKKELNKINSTVMMLDKYEENYNKMTINMELSYRINKLYNLSDTSAKKIELNNVAHYNTVQHKLTVLQRILDQFTDIKSIIFSPAGQKDTVLHGLDPYLNMFTYDKVFQKHVKDFLLQDDKYDQYTRLEYYRDQHPSLSAYTAGYNNLTCSTIMNTLNKLANTVSTIKDNWYINTPRYSSKNQNRVTNILKSLTSQEYVGDNGTPYDTLCERVNRYHFAVKFVTMVVCPIILKEMESLISVMNDLRHHLVLGEDSKDITTNKVHPLNSKYQDDNTFFKFISNGLSSVFITSGIEYCYNKNEKAYQSCNTLNCKFNRAQVKSVTTTADVPNLSMNKTIAKFNSWTKILNGFNLYMDGTINTEFPIGNWETYKPDMDKYNVLIKDCTNYLINELDVSTKSDISPFHSVQLNSQYRNNLEHQLRVPANELGYDNKSLQWDLKLTLDVLQSELERLGRTQNKLMDTLKFIKGATSTNDKQLQAIKYCIGDLSQILNFVQHDLDQAEKIFID